jgi:hypothetical protein
MVDEGLINEREALMRIDMSHMQYFLHPVVDKKRGDIKVYYILIRNKLISCIR